MNEAQEKVVEQESKEENVLVDIEEPSEKKEEAPKVEAKEEELRQSDATECWSRGGM